MTGDRERRSLSPLSSCRSPGRRVSSKPDEGRRAPALNHKSVRQPTTKENAVLAAWTFGEVMWSMLVFFAWIMFFMLLFRVFGDLFSRHDIGGGAKVGWTILVIVLPFLGIFIYLISQGQGMAERTISQVEAQQAQMDDYVR